MTQEHEATQITALFISSELKEARSQIQSKQSTLDRAKSQLRAFDQERETLTTKWFSSQEKLGDLEGWVSKLTPDNELLSKSYANSKKKKETLYLDVLLASMTYVEEHFGIVEDFLCIK